jgi:hypothetical protein
MTFTVYEDQYMYLSHISQFFLECGMLQTKVVEELKKAHFVFSNFFFEKHAVCEKFFKKYCRVGAGHG